MDHNLRASRHLAIAVCPTSVLTGFQKIWIVFVGPIFALLLFVVPTFAQTMPENASAKSYGDGWECNIGYRLSDEDCVAILIPENAYETNRSYGTGWECLHGFLNTDDKGCIAVVVPDGGFLDHTGERWRCRRGFMKIGETCKEITVPENGYLIDSTYGSAWKCDRGFEKLNDGCAAIAVPLNGYLNGSNYGRPWSCQRGFYEQDGLCVAVVIPKFAYFDDASYSEGWRCHRGYAASDAGCEAISIPANGHLDRSGNRWECNRNFQKSKGQCVLRN